jgi:hypothetical protein
VTAGLFAVCTRPIPGLGDHPTRTLAFAAPCPAPASASASASPPARTGPLTWAQQHTLMLIQAPLPPSESANLRFSLPLRLGVCEDDVLAAVRDLMETFEALRTVYVPAPDGPGQRVLRSGELTIPVIAAAKGASMSTAAEVADDMWSVPFDITGEWPVRVALVTAEGRPRHLVVVASHLALDPAGGTWMRYHLRGVLARQPTDVRLPARVHHPLDEAEWERSDAGRRHAERALARHERAFRAMPQTMLPRPAGPVAAPETPRHRFLRFDSAAVALATATLARRHNVDPAAVLYAAICAVSGFVGGLDRSFLGLTAGNRETPRTRFAVGVHAQGVPGCVDVADRTLSDVITQAGRLVLDAARFGQYPPAELAARRRAVEIDRGVAFDLSCGLDYRSARLPCPSDDAACPGDAARRAGGRPNVLASGLPVRPPRAPTPAEMTDRTRWRWAGGVDGATSTYFVTADDSGDMIRLSMLVDTALLPPDEAVAWLRAVERLLCAAMTTADIGTPEIGDITGLAPAARPDDWCLTECGWAHVPTVADLVHRAAGERRAEVFAAPGPGGHHLLAYVDGTRSGVDITRLHVACVDALPGVRIAVAPHHYVVCAGAATGEGLAGWQRLPVLAKGTGRPD